MNASEQITRHIDDHVEDEKAMTTASVGSRAAASLDTHAKKRLVTGYILTGLVALFLTFDTVMKVLRLAPAVQGTTELGYPVGTVIWIGVIELACLVLYLAPRTSVLGALLLTGYLGGAIATHVRVGSPLASHTLFPIYVAVMAWGGLYLRETRLRELIPFRRGS
jgi:DoxX-like family